jgi:intracellular sulfur oxidation DsrE/DsrF family protein
MTTRGSFLIAGATVAAAVTPGATSAASSPYDFAAVAAALAIPARHRQVFAVARVAGGSAASLMRHSLDAYEVTRGEGPGALHAAAVFYARGVVLGLNDDAWHRYRLAEAVRRRGESLDAPDVTINPFARDLRALGTRGCTYLVCDNALADWATFLATSGFASDASIDDVRVDLRRALIPGAYLVPAGVAALNDAQEARFTYVQASL